MARKSVQERTANGLKAKLKCLNALLKSRKKNRNIEIKKEDSKPQRKWKEPCGDDFITTINTLVYLKQYAEEVYATWQSEASKKNIESVKDLLKFCGFFMTTNIFK